MNEKEQFGELAAEDLNIGDIVQWTTWNTASQKWDKNYGVLMKLENVIRSSRMVSIATVKPLNEQYEEKELFTLSLKLVKPHSFDSEMNS